MMNNYLTRAIQSLRPGSEFSFIEDDYSTIKFDILEGKPPTAKEIETEINRLKKADADLIVEIASRKQEILARLGITEDEARIILS